MSVAPDGRVLEILLARLVNITEESWTTIRRTAFSMVIGESQDFGCEILDGHGDSLVHSPRSTPAFNLALPRTLRALLDAIPATSLDEGDVLITNDPWTCAGHLSDVALVTPVFRNGQIVAFVGSIAHWSDVGGTLDSVAASEVYEEGLQIPPLKAWIKGRPNETLRALIRQNVRKSELVIGDLEAQFIGNAIGRQRLIEFMDEYRFDDLVDLSREIQGRAEIAMRDAIGRLPDGDYRFSLTCDALGEPIRLPVRIHINDTNLVVDYDGAPSQLRRGAISCPLSFTTAHTVYAVKCILTPEIMSNAGCFRPISVKAPAGSILNCNYPAAVNLRTLIGWFCAPAVFGALSRALPNAVQSFTAKPIAVTTYGRNANGSHFNDYLLYGGGQGASARFDGRSGLIFPPSAANTSVEVVEARSGLLVECKALIPDSGGAGMHRGGLGQRIRVRKLHDDGLPVQISLQPPDTHTNVPALAGGKAGARYSVRLEANGKSKPVNQGLIELTRVSEVLEFDLGGGAGYGDPGARRDDDLRFDLDAGYVTPRGLKQYRRTIGNKGRPGSASPSRP